MKTMDLNAQEAHLLAVLSSQRFLRMEGLSNEVPFFIYPFPPEASLAVAQAKKRIKTKLSTKHGVTVREVNLYDLSVEILKGRGVWERVPQLLLAPALRAKLQDGAFDIVFLTGIGEVFPYIRSHNVLNNLQSVVTGKPMLMFFPGDYRQSDSLGSSLVLFNTLTDDQYYRAKNILEQEA